MDFSLTEEQRMLQETVGRFVADRYTFDHRKGYLEKPEGHDPAVAVELNELGLGLVMVPEEQGGLGGNAFDAMVVGEALGPGLVLEPVLEAMVGVTALSGGDSEVLEDAASCVLGVYERGQRYSTVPVGTKVEGGKITGAKTLCSNPATAKNALVSAVENGEVGVYHVNLDAEGATVFNYPLQDGRPYADLVFDGVPAKKVGGLRQAEIDAAVAQMTIAECAFAVGAMQTALDITKEYLSVRKQFGRPLAAFQALQFRLVDMNMEVQDARSMAIWAASQATTNNCDALLRAASMAKAKIGKAATHVAEEAMQLHGGMGVTMEYSVSAYAKYLTTFNLLHGDVDYHTSRMMRLS